MQQRITLTTYTIDVSVNGNLMYEVDVPSTLGPKAAERRARMAVALQTGVELDSITATAREEDTPEYIPADVAYDMRGGATSDREWYGDDWDWD